LYDTIVRFQIHYDIGGRKQIMHDVHEIYAVVSSLRYASQGFPDTLRVVPDDEGGRTTCSDRPPYNHFPCSVNVAIHSGRNRSEVDGLPVFSQFQFHYVPLGNRHAQLESFGLDPVLVASTIDNKQVPAHQANPLAEDFFHHSRQLEFFRCHDERVQNDVVRLPD